MRDASDSSILGSCSLNHIDPYFRLGNLAYWVRSSRLGEGIASRAVRLVTRFAFEQVGLIRAEIVVAEANLASLRVAEKVGALREGVLRNRLIIHGQIFPGVMHSLIPKDFGLNPLTLPK